MKVSKKVQQSHKTLSRYQIIMGLMLLALVLVIALVSQRLTSVERYVGLVGLSTTMQSLADSTHRPLTIDATAKTAAIPELSLVMPYDAWLTSQVRYDMQRSADSPTGIISITTVSELNKSINKVRDYNPKQNDGCWLAYQMSIGGEDIDEGMEEISRHALNDGRTAVVYKSTDKACTVYFGGSDSKDLAALLQKVDSY